MTFRILALATLLLASTAAFAPPAAGVGGAVVVAHGPIHRSYDSDPVFGACEGPGYAVVTIELRFGRFAVANENEGCVPGWSTLTGGCTGTETGDITCRRDTATTHIEARLAADGAFLFVWETPEFREVMTGTLERR